MATSPFGGFANLDPAQAELAQRRAATASPLDALIQGFQGGQQIQQLPQQLAQQQLAQQLQNALVQQKLQDLQNPQAAMERNLLQKFNEQLIASSFDPTSGIRRAGVGAPPAGEIEPVINPINGQETPFVRDLAQRREALARTLPAARPFEFGNQLVEKDPTTGQYRSVFTAPPVPLKPSGGKTEFVRSLSDPKDIRLAEIFPGQAAPEGYELLRTEDKGMKPSEKITAQREIRNVYDELPAKIDFFGKGQIPGSDQLKTRLDAVLKPVQGDFSKLNPQAANTFIFALNKLRDPTSATLLAEASQIAVRAGILDRFNAYIENIKSGNQVSPQVAKDIYDVISQVHSVHRENLINSLIPLKEDADSLGSKLTSIGVPKAFVDEIDARISQGATPSQASIPVTSPVATPGINPAAPSPIRNPVNQEAINWLRDNPNDPRAPAARRKLGL